MRNQCLRLAIMRNNNTQQPLSTIIDVSVRSGLDASSALDASGRSPESCESKESISDDAAFFDKVYHEWGINSPKSITSEGEKKLSK